MNRNTKSVIVIILCVAVLGLSIGYAALNSILNITGTAKLGPTASSWNIRFENAKCEASGYAESGTITTEGTDLELSGSILKAPSDAVTCTFDVVNKGTLDAKVISVTEPNKDSFTYTGRIQPRSAPGDTKTYDEELVKSGLLSEMKYNDAGKTVIKVGDTLNAGATKKLYIKISYRDDLTELPYDEVEISDIFAQIIYGQAAVGEKETTESDFPELAYKIGSKWQLDPGDGILRNFYILSESGNNVSLIMDQNLGGNVAWNVSGNNADGPVTANEALAQRTSNWKISPILIKYDEVKAMLPACQGVSEEECLNMSWDAYDDSEANVNRDDYSTELEWIKAIISYEKLNYKDLVLPDFMVENILNTCDSDFNCETYGYWTASPIAGDSNFAWGVFNDGRLFSSYVDDSDDAGLRPVITLSKSKLSEIGNISQSGSEESGEDK